MGPSLIITGTSSPIVHHKIAEFVQCGGKHHKRQVSQMLSLLAASHEPAGSYNRLLEVLYIYVFEHKMHYLLIHTPYTHILVLWHISNMPPLILWSHFFYNTPVFCIAAIFLKYCSTTVSWLLYRMSWFTLFSLLTPREKKNCEMGLFVCSPWKFIWWGEIKVTSLESVTCGCPHLNLIQVRCSHMGTGTLQTITGKSLI